MWENSGINEARACQQRLVSTLLWPCPASHCCHLSCLLIKLRFSFPGWGGPYCCWQASEVGGLGARHQSGDKPGPNVRASLPVRQLEEFGYWQGQGVQANCSGDCGVSVPRMCVCVCVCAYAKGGVSIQGQLLGRRGVHDWLPEGSIACVCVCIHARGSASLQLEWGWGLRELMCPPGASSYRIDWMYEGSCCPQGVYVCISHQGTFMLIGHGEGQD